MAAGFAFAALGTDDGGSNRIPAQFTGVVGMKPTFGLVPRTGVIPTWPVLDTHGPLARSVADAALLLDAIAGPDASDGYPLRAPYVRGSLAKMRDAALQGARLGVVDAHIPRAQMSAESIVVFDRAVADCVAAGAVVEACAPRVTRENFREQFVAASKVRGGVPPDANSSAATANALPSGYCADGMPAGNLSFVGLPGSDARVLALAHAYERVSQRFRAPKNFDG